MKKITQRFLSLLLVTVILIGMVPVTANAESQRDAIVRIALAEEGVSGCPNKYTYAYGQIGGSYNWGWCAAFIYWCAQQAGIPHSIIGRTASASVNSFNTPYYSYSSGSNVQKGDILYLQNNYGNHVGLVYAVDATYIYTIEGNMGNAVKKYKYRRSDGYITWSSSSEWQRIAYYGVPNYENEVQEPTTILYPTNGGIYKIAYGGGNNMYLDFALSSNNVQIFENCDGHSDPAFVKSQYFKLTHVGDGWYSIINVGNGKAIDIAGINPTSGTNIQQWEYLGNDGQLYRFYDAGNGYCYIKSKLGTYIDKKDGDTSSDTNVWSYEFNGTIAQKWKLEKHSHSYSSQVTKAATCTAAGVKTFTCSKCSHSYTESIAATGHKWNAATCTAAKTCSVCKTTSGSALGHSYTSKVTKAATCTAAGVETFTCSKCSHSYTESIAATGHTWTAATCTAPKTCSVCKATEGNALGHSEEIVPAVTASCTATGLSEGKKCSVCEKTLVEQTVISMTEHTDNDNNGSCDHCNAQLTSAKLLGDLDGDGRVTSSDARLALRASVGLETLNDVQKVAADVDNDGRISSADARLILRVAVGLETL